MHDAELEFEAELEDLVNTLLDTDLESEAEMFAPAAIRGPIFDVACTGCAAGQCTACPDGQCAACPIHGGGCRAVVAQAIIEAITLARNAADKIDAAISVARTSRNPAARETARLFRAFFCHDPSDVIPWTGGPSGASVAQRFRAVARELGGGRRIHFICRETRDPCGDVDETCCSPGDFAFTMPLLAGRGSTIFLCAPFWDDIHLPGLPNEDRRGGTILHETLHMLFGHGPESGRHGIHGILDADPKRANAHCYKAFALRVNGFGQDPVARDGCGPC
jgi:hypothetical protein